MSVAPLQILAPGVRLLVNRHQREIFEYLKRRTASCASNSADGASASLTLNVTGSRRRAKRSAARTLEQLAGLVTPDTILRSYRELIAKKCDR
jgi:hypothetical protein